jgi:hypothetical protein
MRIPRTTSMQILNAAARTLRRVASPWMGVLWICTLPLRLAQLYFLYQLQFLAEAGPQHYLYYLWRLAAFVFIAFLVSLYGRAVFVRACWLAPDGVSRAKLEPLKVPLGDFVPYAYTALIFEFLFYIGMFTLIAPWPFLIFGGLAAAASYGIGGPKILRAPASVFALLNSWRSLVLLCAITLLFALALFFVYVNLYVLVIVLLMLFGSFLGSSLPVWQHIFEPGLLTPKEQLATWMLMIGAAMIVEPFWLAANVELVQKIRAQKSGDDLRLWFQDLKKEAR